MSQPPLKMPERPLEVLALVNPAFCSMILREFVRGYEAESGENPMFILAFLCLPIVLSEHSRKMMGGTNATTGLQSWLAKHPEVLVGIGERIKNTAMYTREALLFGSAAEILEVTSEGTVADGKMKGLRKTKWTELDERKDCLAKANRLGKWFGRIRHPETVFISLGVSI